MSGLPEIPLDEEILFLKSIVIPAFDQDRGLENSKQRKEWMKSKAERFLTNDMAVELMDRFCTISSLNEAKAMLAELKQERQQQSAPVGTKRTLEVRDESTQPGLLNRVVRFFWSSTTATTYRYYRVTGTIEDSRTSKGYRSTIYKCAQDHMAYYCENGTKRSIFYDGDSSDMQINLLFKNEAEAFSFQNDLVNFRFAHPTFGDKIRIDEAVDEVYLSEPSKRVFHLHYDGADNIDSPVLSLADIRHVLSSNSGSVCYDPVKALQSLEDITVVPGLKYYWCHLVSRKVAAVKNNVNNCIWGTWIFHQYFDALNTEVAGLPLIAVKYVSTAEQTEDVPAGDKMVTRKRVTVAIEFIENEVGRRVAIFFQGMMKQGTTIIDALHYSSFLYPKDPVEFQKFLEEKYAETMKAWEERDSNSGDTLSECVSDGL